MKKGIKLPYSSEIEQSLVGSMLIEPDVFKQMYERDIKPKHFVVENHRYLVGVAYDTYKKHGHVDAKFIIDYIEQNNEERDVDKYLLAMSKLVDNAGAVSATEYYIDLLEEKYQQRELMKLSQDILQGLSTFDGNFDEYKNDIENKMLGILREGSNTDMKDSVEVAQETLDEFRNAIHNKGELIGMTTGLSNLDYVTNGLHDGDLIILGARPSMGKTAFALQLALNVAQLNEGASVAFFSLEMPSRQLGQRLFSSMSGVEMNKIKNGVVNNEEFNAINQSANQFAQLNFFVDDDGGVTMNDIKQKCRTLHKEDKLDMVFIDYLQLINTPSEISNQNRQQIVAGMSRELKQLARELDVPILVLSQLSRAVEQREDKVPMLADLRESGSIEQDADLVMFLYRDDYYNMDDEELEQQATSHTLLRIAKHRNGSLADLDYQFDRRRMKFYPMAHDVDV